MRKSPLNEYFHLPSEYSTQIAYSQNLSLHNTEISITPKKKEKMREFDPRTFKKYFQNYTESNFTVYKEGKDEPRKSCIDIRSKHKKNNDATVNTSKKSRSHSQKSIKSKELPEKTTKKSNNEAKYTPKIYTNKTLKEIFTKKDISNIKKSSSRSPRVLNNITNTNILQKVNSTNSYQFKTKRNNDLFSNISITPKNSQSNIKNPKGSPVFSKRNKKESKIIPLTTKNIATKIKQLAVFKKPGSPSLLPRKKSKSQIIFEENPQHYNFSFSGQGKSPRELKKKSKIDGKFNNHHDKIQKENSIVIKDSKELWGTLLEPYCPSSSKKDKLNYFSHLFSTILSVKDSKELERGEIAYIESDPLIKNYQKLYDYILNNN